MFFFFHFFFRKMCIANVFFVPLVFLAPQSQRVKASDGRVYRTGDLASWSDEKGFELHGRQDHQAHRLRLHFCSVLFLELQKWGLDFRLVIWTSTSQVFFLAWSRNSTSCAFFWGGFSFESRPCEVKISGIRIESLEIELAVEASALVERCICLLQGTKLVAHCVLGEEGLVGGWDLGFQELVFCFVFEKSLSKCEGLSWSWGFRQQAMS